MQHGAQILVCRSWDKFKRNYGQNQKNLLGDSGSQYLYLSTMLIFISLNNKSQHIN